MKKIISFLVWKAKKADPFSWLFLLLIIIYWTSIVLGYQMYGNIFAIIVIFSILFKIAVYDNFVSSWKEYKEEQQKLIFTIKNSTKD